MEDKTYCIYGIINTINNKIYIGRTCNLKKRIKEHFNTAFNPNRHQYDKPLYKDIRTFGRDNFDYGIIVNGLSYDDAKGQEVLYTSILLADNIEYGYNINTGDNKSDDTRAKISESLKEGYANGLIIPKGVSRFGEDNPNFGNKWTDDMKAHMSATMKGKQARGKHSQARKAVCVETKVIFECLADASDWCGVKASTISRCCSGKLKTAGGYHWMYYEDYLEQNKEE